MLDLDHFLDFARRRLSVAIEEWFRVMEWLLVISALSFAGKASDNAYIEIFAKLSVFALLFYVSVIYFEKFRRSFPIIPRQQRTKSRMLLRFMSHTSFFIVLSVFNYRLIAVAREFATNLAEKLNG
jgi:hypothetical protein